VTILVRHTELELPSHPTLVRRKESKSTGDVVEHGVLPVFGEKVHVEKSSEV